MVYRYIDIIYICISIYMYICISIYMCICISIYMYCAAFKLVLLITTDYIIIHNDYVLLTSRTCHSVLAHFLYAQGRCRLYQDRKIKLNAYRIRYVKTRLYVAYLKRFVEKTWKKFLNKLKNIQTSIFML